MNDADIGERKSMYSGLTVEQEREHLEVGEGQSRGRGCSLCEDVHGRDGGHPEARASHAWAVLKFKRLLVRLKTKAERNARAFE